MKKPFFWLLDLIFAPIKFVEVWAGWWGPIILELSLRNLPWIYNLPLVLASYYNIFHGIPPDTFFIDPINPISPVLLPNTPLDYHPILLTPHALAIHPELYPPTQIPIYDISSSHTSSFSSTSTHGGLRLSWDYPRGARLSLYNLPPHPISITYVPTETFLTQPPFNSFHDMPSYTLPDTFSSPLGNTYLLTPQFDHFSLRVPHTNQTNSIFTLSQYPLALTDIGPPLAESSTIRLNASYSPHTLPISPSQYRIYCTHNPAVSDISYNIYPLPDTDLSFLNPQIPDYNSTH